MSKKNVVFVHGIGDEAPDFYKAFIPILQQNGHDMSKFDVCGLYWEDILDEIQNKYPTISSNFSNFLECFGLKSLKNNLDQHQSIYKQIEDYYMDVLVFVCLPDMAQLVNDRCLMKLKKLSEGRERDTIIIAHSLGAAMIPYILWHLREFTFGIPYGGLILLASPLGFRSPINKALHDFLYLMGLINNTDRESILRDFALEWTLIGDKTLHFICNTNDVVCSDVKFPIMGTSIDPIPVQQGFTTNEIGILNSSHRGCFHKVTFGSPAFDKIASNHDFKTYLKTQAFIDAFNHLISQ